MVSVYLLYKSVLAAFPQFISKWRMSVALLLLLLLRFFTVTHPPKLRCSNSMNDNNLLNYSTCFMKFHLIGIEHLTPHSMNSIGQIRIYTTKPFHSCYFQTKDKNHIINWLRNQLIDCVFYCIAYAISPNGLMIIIGNYLLITTFDDTTVKNNMNNNKNCNFAPIDWWHRCDNDTVFILHISN